MTWLSSVLRAGVLFKWGIFKKMLDIFLIVVYFMRIRRRVEQLAARRAHNPEVVGSSPTPAKFEKASLI